MYAEEVGHYWKTGQSSPDTWIEKAKTQIIKIGGTVLAEGFGSDNTGRSAYMLGFELDGERFKVIWPVLTPKGGDIRSARRQAATMLFHHVKAACMSSRVLGTRAAFFAHLMLPDGIVAMQVANPELVQAIPKMLMSTST